MIGVSICLGLINDTLSMRMFFFFSIEMKMAVDKNQLGVIGHSVNVAFLPFPHMTVSKMLWQQKYLTTSGQMW